MGKMLKMWDMCLSKKKKRVGLSQKKKRKEESGSVANSLLLRTNNLDINFNQKKKKKQLSYKLATTRNTSHKQRRTKMEDVKEGLPHVFCSFKKVLASTQQTRLAREITRREVRKKKNSFSKLIRGHKLQRASRRKKQKEKLKKGLCFPIYRTNRFVYYGASQVLLFSSPLSPLSKN